MTQRSMTRRLASGLLALAMWLTPATVFAQARPLATGGANADAPATPLADAPSDTPAIASKVTDPKPEDPKVKVMPDVIVTATRSERPLFDLPFTGERIDAEKMRHRGYRTFPEALLDTPGVMVQQTAHGQGSPYIRGFTGYLTLFMVDGVRLNNSVFRSGPNQYTATVDMHSVDRLEVVKGPSSVLYGSDAVGGTVNAITVNPYAYDYDTERGMAFGDARVAGRAFYRFASAEDSHQGRGEISVGYRDHTGLVAGGTVKDFGDLEGGDEIGEMPETGYEDYAADVKLEHFFTPDTRLVILHQRVRQNNVPRTHRTRDIESWEGTSVGSDIKRELDQERELTYIQFHAENVEGAFFDTVRASLSYQHQAEERDRIRSSGALQLQGFDVDTIGFWVQMESPTPIGRLTYGVEYYHDEVDSFSSTNSVQGPVGDDATYDLLGLYIQNEITFGERWRVILGGRFTYAAADADSVSDPETGEQISISDDWSAGVGSARVLYEAIPDHLNLFAGVSQGFRAPNLSDLTRFDSARSDEFEIPSPGLDPEFYTSFEIGAKGRTDTLAADISAYYVIVDDQIQRFTTGNTNVDGDFEVAKANIGDGYVYGIEAGAAWNFLPELTAFGNITFMEGKVKNTIEPGGEPVDEYLTRLMPLSGQVGLRYDSNTLPVWVETVVRLADKQDKLSSSDARDTTRIPPSGTPGYAVWSIRGGWRPVDNVEISLAVDNITNEDYRIHGSGLNRPGRNVIVSVDAEF